MSVHITATYEGGGGHTRFDFEIDPQASEQQKTIFHQGMQIEETIARSGSTAEARGPGSGTAVAYQRH